MKKGKGSTERGVKQREVLRGYMMSMVIRIVFYVIFVRIFLSWLSP